MDADQFREWWRHQRKSRAATARAVELAFANGHRWFLEQLDDAAFGHIDAERFAEMAALAMPALFDQAMRHPQAAAFRKHICLVGDQPERIREEDHQMTLYDERHRTIVFESGYDTVDVCPLVGKWRALEYCVKNDNSHCRAYVYDTLRVLYVAANQAADQAQAADHAADQAADHARAYTRLLDMSPPAVQAYFADPTHDTLGEMTFRGVTRAYIRQYVMRKFTYHLPGDGIYSALVQSFGDLAYFRALLDRATPNEMMHVLAHPAATVAALTVVLGYRLWPANMLYVLQPLAAAACIRDYAGGVPDQSGQNAKLKWHRDRHRYWRYHEE